MAEVKPEKVFSMTRAWFLAVQETRWYSLNANQENSLGAPGLGARKFSQFIYLGFIWRLQNKAAEVLPPIKTSEFMCRRAVSRLFGLNTSAPDIRALRFFGAWSALLTNGVPILRLFF
mgnify:CR=1 FL=1